MVSGQELSSRLDVPRRVPTTIHPTGMAGGADKLNADRINILSTDKRSHVAASTCSINKIDRETAQDGQGRHRDSSDADVDRRLFVSPGGRRAWRQRVPDFPSLPIWREISHF